MLVMETIAKIRRAFFVQGKPIKSICRELRVSRKVVRKVIRSEATEFRYEREAQPLPNLPEGSCPCNGGDNITPGSRSLWLPHVWEQPKKCKLRVILMSQKILIVIAEKFDVRIYRNEEARSYT
jgi:hypothetical protein